MLVFEQVDWALQTVGACAWAVVRVCHPAHIQASSTIVGVFFGVGAKLQASELSSLSQEARMALGFTLTKDIECRLALGSILSVDLQNKLAHP